MAAYMTFTPEHQKMFDNWVSERPLVIQEMIRKLPPNRLYMNKKSGHRMTIISYEEDETVTATVSGRYNLCIFERNVFGISVNDLVECDLPKGGEPLGAFCTTPEDVESVIKTYRNNKLL